MYENDNELGNLLDSTELESAPDPARMQAVRQRALHLADRSAARGPRVRTSLVAVLVLIGITGVGLATTETGRRILRWVTTPIQEEAFTTWEAPDGTTWSRTQTGRSEPYSDEEKEQVADEFAECNAIQEAGGGRLAGLIEGPGFLPGMPSHTVYMIEYELSNGQTNTVGSGQPSALQAENMRLDEILELRNAGEGEIISEQPAPIGMGRYTIRFTLSDGETVDLQTVFPPSTKEEREAIFAEMQELKQQLRFKVIDPYVDPENHLVGVWGLLQYTLADGRTVGSASQVPPEAISEDGTQVILPELKEPIAIEGAAAKFESN